MTMRCWIGFFVWFSAWTLSATAQQKVAFDFEQAELGKLPPGFVEATGGPGMPAKWTIEEDPTAPAGKKVLSQTSTDDPSMRFPMCIHDGLSAKDVTISVQFKAISGETDQAAGLVARWKDKDNYYIVRANSLENNVRLYKVENGRRQPQFGAKNIEVSKDKWHTLTLDVTGPSFTVSLNGQQLFTAEDSTFTTAGKVGLWTKADSVTRFDALTIQAK